MPRPASSGTRNATSTYARCPTAPSSSASPAKEAAHRYADDWIVSITDVTPLAHAIHTHVRTGDLDTARSLLPLEPAYTTQTDLAHLYL